jgi:hypothetical protein
LANGCEDLRPPSYHDVGLNGRQVADAARALRPELKVLFITGYAENAALNHGHIERGMEVLTKPFAVASWRGGWKGS